jgi:flagella basal body P-ring formation protein FlgA
MLLFALFISFLGVGEPAKPAISDDHVRAAIVAAVRQRMGSDIDVAVDNLVVQVAPGSAIVEAVPEPGARLEGDIRFILRWAGTERSGRRSIKSGAAVARVRVTANHAHTATLATRGVELGPDDVIGARHEIVAGPLRPWPTVAQTVGSKTLRDLPPDVCIVRGAITDRPDVRTGQDVLAITRIDGVVASAGMVAAESGDTGSVIRVVNQQSRRAFKARIVSAGLVEILK